MRSVLWFDVGIKRYTTINKEQYDIQGLRFDVGIKRYTTNNQYQPESVGCGLMQESKDIQQIQYSLQIT